MNVFLDYVPSILAVVSAALSVLATALVGGWWIRGQFLQVQNTFFHVFHDHEEKDQQRHIDNLGKFADIEIRLARMGNGKEHAERE